MVNNIEEARKADESLTFTVPPEDAEVTKTEPLPTEEEYLKQFEDDKNPLTEKEIEIARELKLFKPKEEVKKEDKPAEKKEDKKEMTEDQKKILADSESEKEVTTILDKIEKDQDISVEEERSVTKHLTGNGQGLYYRMKEERRKRQFIQKQNEMLKKEIDETLAALNNKPKTKKTIETETETEDEDAFVSRKEFRKMMAESEEKKKQVAVAEAKKEEELAKQKEERASQLKNRWDNAEVLMLDTLKKEKELVDIEKTDWIIQAATEVMKDDETGAYTARMREIAGNLDSPSLEQDLIKFTYRLAKLHPDYEELKKSGKKSDGNGSGNGEDKDNTTEKIDKIIKNSEKKTSASIGGGGNRRTLTLADITPEIAARMSISEFGRLPKWKQDELLGKD